MRVLSFGEVLFDVFENDAYIGGAPLNLAAHSAIQGADAYLLSAVGNDEYGKQALLEVKNLDVKCDYVSVLEDRETGKCLVTLDENAVPSYNILKDVAYDHIPRPYLMSEKFDVFAFGTLAFREKENMRTVENVLENEFLHIYSDLNIRPPFYSKESILFCLKNATILKISDEELPVVAESVFGKELDISSAIAALAEEYIQLEVIIITCGDAGVYAWKKGDDKLHYCEAVKTEVVSTVGAGDSFGATFLVEYIKSGDLDAALLKSAKVSAFVVSQKGAIPEGAKEFVKNLT